MGGHTSISKSTGRQDDMEYRTRELWSDHPNFGAITMAYEVRLNSYANKPGPASPRYIQRTTYVVWRRREKATMYDGGPFEMGTTLGWLDGDAVDGYVVV